jgi:hypothetical protein
MSASPPVSRDLVLRVISWGIAAYLFVIGFSLDRHALFELRSAPETTALEAAQAEYSRQLIVARQKALASGDLVEAAKLNVAAMEAAVQVAESQDLRRDCFLRALSLIGSVSLFCLAYIGLIFWIYRVRGIEEGTENYFISYRAALTIACSLSAVTLFSAVMTAYY